MDEPNIQIGTRYMLEPSSKKSILEEEVWVDEQGRRLCISEVWRWGEWYVIPQNEDEVEWLVQATKEEDTDFDPYMFEESEFGSTWDGCSSGLHFIDTDDYTWTEEEKERIDNELWEDRWEWLENNGFDSDGCEYTIHSTINLTQMDEGYRP